METYVFSSDRVAILLAAMQGKTIQVRKAGVDNPWMDRRNLTGSDSYFPLFDWNGYDYRVKPEPQVMYVNTYRNCGGKVYRTGYETEEHAREVAKLATAVDKISVAVRYVEETH